MNVELKIVINEAGQVGISGPIENKMLCYGLLEIAREIIYTHNEQNKKLVQPATFAGFPTPS